MAHKKGQGATRNGRDSNPQYMGVKLYGGQFARSGSIILRQRGTRFTLGSGVSMGKDYTIFAIQDGIVHFAPNRKVSVKPAAASGLENKAAKG